MRGLDESVDAGRTEYLVIGAGIAGLSAAYHLSKDGHSVRVLDAGDGTDNASFNSTAELNHDPDARWEKVVKQFGIDGARQVWTLSDLAMAELSAFAHQSGEPHFSAERKPAHLFTYHQGEQGTTDGIALREKYDFYQRIGAHVELVENTAAMHPSFTAAMTILDEGATNNQMLLEVLARSAREHGAKIVRRVKAVHLDERSDSVVVTTEDGSEYEAAQVIIANGDGRGLIPLPIDRVRTFVVSFEKHGMPELFRSALLWDTDEPFHYMRSFAGARLWVGGEDVREAAYVHDKTHDEARFARLEKYAKDVLHINDSYVRQAAWSGVFFPSERGLPYIGAASPRLHLSLGFGGSGILTSFISGYLHAAWRRGERLEYKPLFATDWTETASV